MIESVVWILPKSELFVAWFTNLSFGAALHLFGEIHLLEELLHTADRWAVADG